MRSTSRRVVADVARFSDSGSVLRLYAASGAGDFLILQEAPEPEMARLLLANVTRILRARGEKRAADLLTSIQFRLVDATNHFNDEFSMLHAVVPLEHYERLRQRQSEPSERQAFKIIAEVAAELGTYVRFIVVGMAMEAPKPRAQGTRTLSDFEIKRLVQRWIGVSGGYLGDFSYRSHAEFYADLGLSIEPNQYQGTTRERFMKILAESSAEVQATILDGILVKYPVGSAAPEGSAAERTPKLHDEIRNWSSRLRGMSPVMAPALAVTSDVVERALRDAEELLHKSGAPSSVDRVHTALHGYLHAVCAAQDIPTSDDPTIPQLLKRLREQHPAFAELGPRAEDIMRVLRALGSICDTLNPLRNMASVAHPNAELLPESEAMLVVNAVRTILHYLDSKLHPRSGN